MGQNNFNIEMNQHNIFTFIKQRDKNRCFESRGCSPELGMWNLEPPFSLSRILYYSRNMRKSLKNYENPDKNLNMQYALQCGRWRVD